MKEYAYCTCRTIDTNKYSKDHERLFLTETKEDDICVHCGYYAIMLPYEEVKGRHWRRDIGAEPCVEVETDYKELYRVNGEIKQ